MRYSYRWLRELSGTKKTPEQLAKLLMTHAFEVESVERFAHHLEGVMVGEVMNLEVHPNAEKLRIAHIYLGKKDTRQIVCGAPNIVIGQKVAVALPGTVLPGNVIIQETTIRGIASTGMICSAKELGLSDDHTGILVLSADTLIGTAFADAVGLDDTVIEIKILPDRGSDALSYQGIAREIAALDGHAPHFASHSAKPIKIASYNRIPRVTITEKILCQRYIGLALRGITVRQSPLWLKVRLILSGIHPVNNVVDATNYLMLLTGQPIHAFDADLLDGPLAVRRAKKNEKFILLGGKKIILHPQDIVIADTRHAVALAGVMGGQSSAITPATKNIFLEIATFDGPSIRRTRTNHNLVTDASYRFERQLDANLCEETARDANILLTTLAGGKCVGYRDLYTKPLKHWKISLSLKRVEDVLGITLPLFSVVQSLALLGLTVKKIANQEAVSVIVPTRRPDLQDEWNLIEEIGRIHGYDHIPAVAPSIPLTPAVLNPDKQFERRVKKYLSAVGFDELMTYAFYGEREQVSARLLRETHLFLANPLSPEQKLLNMTLAPMMLRKVRENLRHFDHFQCFQWASVFSQDIKKKSVSENKSLFLTSTLAKKSTTPGASFFVLKGQVNTFLQSMGVTNAVWRSLDPQNIMPVTSLMHPTRSAEILVGKTLLGVMGELHPIVARDFGVDERTAIAEFNPLFILRSISPQPFFEPLQKFPLAIRDISLTFPQRENQYVSVANVEALIAEIGAPLLHKSELFDIYEQGTEKRFAFHLSFGVPDRTLSSQEMDEVFDRIVKTAQMRFGAYLRL
ncbi:MAG: phenylalanine--tRNA ligase subunit beta [Minisyncoccota bacterium]